MRTIGEVLQSKRERLGMTLTELEKRTQIQRETLVDIEQNRFDQFKHRTTFVGLFKNMHNLSISMDVYSWKNIMKNSLQSNIKPT